MGLVEAGLDQYGNAVVQFVFEFLDCMRDGFSGVPTEYMYVCTGT